MSSHRGKIPDPLERSGGLPTTVPPVSADTNLEHPSFRFTSCVDSGHYAAHKLDQTQMKALVVCFKKAELLTWQQILATSGGRGKTGLGYTRLKRDQLPGRGDRLSEDLRDRVFELRTGQRGRIMCFRDGAVCHVVWFDPLHDITG